MRIKIILILSFFIGNSYAQQEAQFTMYWNNYSSYNPAATGLFNKHYAALNARTQWTHFEGAPKTISAIYDFKWTKINSGLGIGYVYGQLGFEKNNEINLNYSYQFDLKKDRILSSGISLGFLRKSIDFSKFVAIDNNDPLLISNPIKTDFFFNIAFGLMYKTPHLLIGLSGAKLNESESDKLNYKNKAHYYISCTYNSSIGRNIIIKPGFILKSDIASTQVEINFMTVYKNRYWAGLTYRKADAVGFMAGIDIKGKYRIGYSYDYTISILKNYSRGSHEVVLALMID